MGFLPHVCENGEIQLLTVTHKATSIEATVELKEYIHILGNTLAFL